MADGPVDRRKRGRKKWLLRIAERERTADVRCAECNDCAPPAPIASCVSDAGVIERRWRCTVCGNEWTTSNEV